MKTMKTMKRSAQLAAVALAMIGINLPEAAAERRHSLAENRLILDKDDVFAFPQLAVDHVNLVSIEYGTSYQEGAAMGIFGSEDLAIGVTVHRADLLNRNSLYPYSLQAGLAPGLDGPFGALDGEVAGPNGDPVPGTIFDLFLGAQLSPTMKAGGRLAFGNGESSAEPDGADGPTGASRTYLVAQGGVSLVGDLTLDLSGQLNLEFANQQANGEDALGGTAFGFGVSARAYLDLYESTRLGVLGEAQFNRIGVTNYGAPDNEDDDVTSATTALALQAGVGPEFQVNEKSTVAGYAVLGFANSSFDADVDEDTDTVNSGTRLVIPGIHLAADVAVLDWLYVRSGVQYSWERVGATAQNDDADTTDTATETGARGATEAAGSFEGPGGFGWRAGLGFEVDNFAFDGSFASGFILNGPNFVGGGTGFLAVANAKYNF